MLHEKQHIGSVFAKVWPVNKMQLRLKPVETLGIVNGGKFEHGVTTGHFISGTG